MGCRFTDEDGREIDLDVIHDPTTSNHVEVFDARRVHWFLVEQGLREVPSWQDLDLACQRLASHDDIREVIAGRWFALAERPATD
jgi:hypothetical protein